MSLDRRGIAGCVIATEAFQGAAAAQARALGVAPAMVWVPHPIQNRTEAELAALAESAVEAVLATLAPG